MKKGEMLKEIQNKLPEDIIIHDETTFDLTDDEFIGILTWVSYFKLHYAKFQKTKLPEIRTPNISTRIKLDLGLYTEKSDQPEDFGKHTIYISRTEITNKEGKKDRSLQHLVNRYI